MGIKDWSVTRLVLVWVLGLGLLLLPLLMERLNRRDPTIEELLYGRTESFNLTVILWMGLMAVVMLTITWRWFATRPGQVD